mmetsp:Transcript_29739/g.63071  ORF Transcript_29739/g.63071 Transcript_29739/m.63071 type:complete len:157 (+) Transcript_29739:1037-1507(+)
MICFQRMKISSLEGEEGPTTTLETSDFVILSSNTGIPTTKRKKVDKPKVSKLIVSALRGSNPPSRFLRMNEETTRWEDVGDKRAAEKVSQTLREKDRDAKAEYVARKTVTESLETQASEAVAITATAHVAVQAAPEEMANAVEVAPQQAQVQLFDV